VIIRVDIFCPGCRQKIRLRIGLGVDKIQPFYFVCQNCKAVTSGKIVLGEPPSFLVKFDEENIKTHNHEQPDQSFTFHPDFPSRLDVSDMSSPGGSPFITQIDFMGPDNLQRFGKLMGTFRGLIESDWSSLYRLSEYYLNEDWKYFDEEAKRLLKDAWPDRIREIQRHDIYHKSLEMLFLHIMPLGIYPDLKAEYSALISAIVEGGNEGILRQYIRFLLENFDIKGLQRDIIERLYFIVDKFSSLAPAFPLFFYEDKTLVKKGELRILRDDFNILKSHFLDVFEICHKILTMVVGAHNLLERNHWDSFPNNKPGSLIKYHKLNNYKKPEYIALPKLKQIWDNLFDRNLRNAVGHASVRHNLKTGFIQLDDGTEIPYLYFVYKTLAMTEMILFSTHVVKMIYVIKTIDNH